MWSWQICSNCGAPGSFQHLFEFVPWRIKVVLKAEVCLTKRPVSVSEGFFFCCLLLLFFTNLKSLKSHYIILWLLSGFLACTSNRIKMPQSQWLICKKRKKRKQANYLKTRCTTSLSVFFLHYILLYFILLCISCSFVFMVYYGFL